MNRKKLAGWTIREIDKVSEARAAEIIRESAIFMSFGHPEGFGLPPAEAMAAQTIVVGYHLWPRKWREGPVHAGEGIPD